MCQPSRLGYNSYIGGNLATVAEYGPDVCALHAWPGCTLAFARGLGDALDGSICGTCNLVHSVEMEWENGHGHPLLSLVLHISD